MAPDVLCIGSVHWDMIGRPDPRITQPMARGDDLPGRIVRLPGGVALNVALSLRQLGLRPALLGVVGLDAEGDALIARCAAMGLATEHLTRTPDPTDHFVAIEASEGLLGAIADTRSLEAAGTRILAPLAEGRLGRPWRGPTVIDSNLTEPLLADLVASDLLAGADLRLAPASPGKARRLRCALGHPSAVLYLNLEEANAMVGRRSPDASVAALALLARGAHRAIVTDGPRTVVDATASRLETAQPHAVPVVRFLGAGDAFMAAHIGAEVRGATAPEALTAALMVAADYVSGAA